MRTRASLSVAYMHTLYSTTSKYHSQEKEHDFIKFLIGPFLDLENGNVTLIDVKYRYQNIINKYKQHIALHIKYINMK